MNTALIMNTILSFIIQSLIAALAVSEYGDTLVNRNSGIPMVPASNMKLITTGTALESLGGGYRWETGIAYSGKIENGVLKGDLYIVGGADPTLGAKLDFAEDFSLVLDRWTEMVRRAGIRKIEGFVVGDGRCMDGPMEDPTWLWEDLGTYYGAGASGLSFYENRKTFRVTPGNSVGSALTIEDGYPATPWMEYDFSACSTGKKGTGDKLYLFTSDLAPVGRMRGTFALEKKPKDVECSNKFPEYTCASELLGRLESAGIRCTEGAADLGPVFGLPRERVVPASELTHIGSTSGATLAKVIRETNVESDNFFAEMLFRTMGMSSGGHGSIEESRRAVRDRLEKMGVEGTVVIRDGSGLSRTGYISPSAMCSFLKKMSSCADFPVFLNSLPIAGLEGTVSMRLRELPERQRMRVRMKSGSMEGVRCYSGYILPEEFGKNGDTAKGALIFFSYMVNNSADSSAAMNAAADEFIADLLRN